MMFYVALALLAANIALFVYSAVVGYGDTSEGGEGASTLMTVSGLFGAYFMLPGIFALPIVLYKHASFTTVSWVFFAAFWPLACLAGVQFGLALRAQNWLPLAVTSLCPLVQVLWGARLFLK